MQRLFCFFLITASFFCSSVLFSDTRVLLKPGVGFYYDGMNYSAGIDLETGFNSFSPSFPEGFFTGIGAAYSAVLSTPWVYFNSISGGIEIGYRFSIGNKFLEISPALLAGGAYSQFGNTSTNVNGLNFLLNPSLTVGFWLGDFIVLGLTLDYRYMPIDLPAGPYFSSDLNALVSLSFVIGQKAENRRKSKTEGLSRDLNQALSSNKIQASFTKEGGNEIKLNISDVLFEVNSDAIHPEYMDTLKTIAAMAKNYPEFLILIEGHSDDTGDAGYNRELSEKRARNIAYVFMGADIPPEKITYKGRGKDKPLVPNTSAENRAKNRRVEVRFIWK
jgi:outer membrane protein OmpA-like peptidoglycan-associated protein